MIRSLLLAAVLLAAGGLGGCSKCDVPTFGWSGPFAPSACTSGPPVR